MMKIFKKTLLAAGLVGVALSAAGCQSADSTGNSASNKSLSVVFLPSDSAKEATAARTAVAKELSKATGKKSNRQDDNGLQRCRPSHRFRQSADRHDGRRRLHSG